MGEHGGTVRGETADYSRPYCDAPAGTGHQGYAPLQGLSPGTIPVYQVSLPPRGRQHVLLRLSGTTFGW